LARTQGRFREITPQSSTYLPWTIGRQNTPLRAQGEA
jgi:hypothetical protein